MLLRVHAPAGIMHCGFDMTRNQTARIIVDLVESLGWVDHQRATDTVAQALHILTEQKDALQSEKLEG